MSVPLSPDAWRQALDTFGRRPRNHGELAQAPFVQLFNLETDPGETRNLAAEQPEKVRELLSLVEQQINNGRSTPGPKLKNDRGKLEPFIGIPKFVF